MNIIFVILLLLSPIVTSATGVQDRMRTKRYAQERNWEFYDGCDFPVWVALNTSPGPNYIPKRHMFLFIEAGDFVEANLVRVFTELSRDNPQPTWLMITAASDPWILESLIKSSQSDGYVDFARTPEGEASRKAREQLGPPKTGFLRAFYSRLGKNEESFQYSPNPDTGKLVTVDLKGSRDEHFTGDSRDDLILAARNSDVSKAEELIRLGVDVDSKDHAGDNALMQAKNLKIIELLLQAGAHVDKRNNYGFTALIRASSLGRASIVKALIDGGADINATNKYGNTALISAAMNGHLQVVEILLRKGADFSVTNNLGKNAIAFARERGHIEVASRLETAGAR